MACRYGHGEQQTGNSYSLLACFSAVRCWCLICLRYDPEFCHHLRCCTYQNSFFPKHFFITFIHIPCPAWGEGPCSHCASYLPCSHCAHCVLSSVQPPPPPPPLSSLCLFVPWLKPMMGCISSVCQIKRWFLGGSWTDRIFWGGHWELSQSVDKLDGNSCRSPWSCTCHSNSVGPLDTRIQTFSRAPELHGFSMESDVGYLGITMINKMVSLLISEIISQRSPMPEVKTCKKKKAHKIIDYLKLEGTCKDHLVQLPASCRTT